MCQPSTNPQAAPAPEPYTGFGDLPCPRCGEVTLIRLDLDDLDRLTCGNCEEPFTASEVRELIDAWAPVLRWIESAPRRAE
jgi:transcription elongation factor Elf1